MRKTYPPPAQRNLMLKLCKRKKGVTVQEAREQGVRNPTLQVQEFRLRGFDVGIFGREGSVRKAFIKYKPCWRNSQSA